MRALWPLVGCLLYLAASSAVSSPTQCDWNNLEEMRFHPRTIQVRTKEQMEGKLTVMMGDSEKHYSYSESLEPSRLYTLNLTCDTIHCAYIFLNDDGDKLINQSFLGIGAQFIVRGQNLEWSPYCTETMNQSASGGGDADEVDSKNEPRIWILVMIALGVAVTVVAVGTLTWSIFSLCKKK